MSYQDDKRELLKMKQGIIEESETIHEEEKPVYNLSDKEKRENFFYYHKYHIIIGFFAAAILAFLIITTLNRQFGDIRVLSVTKEPINAYVLEHMVPELEAAFEAYCPDYDNNGYVHAEVYTLDLIEHADPQFDLANTTKLTGEIMYGEAQLFIVDGASVTELTGGELATFVDLGALYPDVSYIDGPLLKIKDSPFAGVVNLPDECTDDLYIAVNNADPNGSNSFRSIPAMEKSLEIVKNIINGNFAGEGLPR
ncbi:MAG: hypothetical protein J6X60_03295 [Ruminiclostridium sp.]|nr:hypothetical protein [Ruminiclostridium sp.]